MSNVPVSVYSHPRSGTHYVTALISTNFYDDDDYMKYCNGHQPFAGSPLNASFAKGQKKKFIYIHRRFDGVAKSIFILRNRFGLKVNSYDKFLNRTYKSMWSRRLNVDVKEETLTGKKYFSSVSNMFRGVDKTPEQYHKWHQAQWSQISGLPNIHLVSYDSLMSDFDAEMSKISKFLGKSNNKFKNIDRQIGWSTNASAVRPPYWERLLGKVGRKLSGRRNR